ncbi:hypothetical protein pipiens_016055 [Culex pipiens pipiens]|uniref:Uncharacterized protein n=1 Tax=Culex pipiens pipiens TaxID=38569 RepID=A0ABD1CN03_CULPP
MAASSLDTQLLQAIKGQNYSVIEHLLTEGADPNFQFDEPEGGKCSLLHIAVELSDAKSVSILLKYDATFVKRDNDGETPWDMAKRVEGSEVYKEFIAYFEAKNVKREQEANRDGYSYKRRPGTASIAGQLYESKLMALVLLRLKECNCKFWLGSNVDGIGHFDDLVIRYYCDDLQEDIIVFVQAKHRDDPEKKKITLEQILDKKVERV